MDYYRTLTILRVNGLSETSSPEDMTRVLAGAGFSEIDISGFLAAHKEQLAHPQAPPGSPESGGVTDPLRPHVEHAELHGPPSPFLHQPPPPKSLPVRIVRALVLLLIIGGAGYVAYTVYAIPPANAVLASVISTTSYQPFHTDIVLSAASSTESTPLSISISADVDPQASSPRANASSTVHSAAVNQTTEMRVVGDAIYVRDASAPSSTWQQVTPNQLADPAFNRSLPTGFHTLVNSRSPQTSTNKLKIMLDTGVLVPSGSPSLGFTERRPTVTYTFLVDPNKLLPWEQANEFSSYALAQNADATISYGPVAVTKDLLTGKLLTITGSVTAVREDPRLGSHITTPYTYTASYQPLEAVSIEAPT